MDILGPGIESAAVAMLDHLTHCARPGNELRDQFLTHYAATGTPQFSLLTTVNESDYSPKKNWFWILLLSGRNDFEQII